MRSVQEMPSIFSWQLARHLMWQEMLRAKGFKLKSFGVTWDVFTSCIRWRSGRRNLDISPHRMMDPLMLNVMQDSCTPTFQFWKEVAKQYQVVSQGGFNVTKLGCKEGIDTFWNWKWRSYCIACILLYITSPGKGRAQLFITENNCRNYQQLMLTRECPFRFCSQGCKCVQPMLECSQKYNKRQTQGMPCAADLVHELIELWPVTQSGEVSQVKWCCLI